MPHANVSRLDNTTLTILQTTWTSNFVSAIYVIVTLVNLFGNGLSMWLLFFRTSPKTPSIIFMINLTITDLALGLALPFQIMYQMQGYNWTLGSSMCNVLTVTFFVNMYCSILTMMAISVERYMGIVRPMHFRKANKKVRYAIFACIVMWGIVLAVLSPLEKTDLTFEIPELNIITCFDVLKKDMLPSIAHWASFLFSMFFILFLLPFIVTVFCYVRIICALIKNSKSKQKGRAVRLAFIVLFVFTFCFAPNNILLFAHTVSKLYYNKSLYMYYKLSLSLSCINSCLDPFIYYLASKDFRRKMRQLLKLPNHSTVDTELSEGRNSARTGSIGKADARHVDRQISRGNSSL